MTILELKSRVYDLIVERDYVMDSAEQRVAEINREIISIQQTLNELLTGENLEE